MLPFQKVPRVQKSGSWAVGLATWFAKEPFYRGTLAMRVI